MTTGSVDGASPLTDGLDYQVRPSRQRRGHSTQTALLDAAEHLFAEQGVEATTVAEIAELAGSSIGSFYHHFGDKETIQFALFDRFVTESEAGTLAAIAPDRWEGAGIADILTSYVRLALSSFHKRPAFKKAGLAIAEEHPELRAHYDQVRTMLDRGLHELLLARRHEIDHPDPELAVTYVVDQINNMLRARRIDRPLETRFVVQPDDDFLRETMRSVSGYLGLESSD